MHDVQAETGMVTALGRFLRIGQLLEYGSRQAGTRIAHIDFDTFAPFSEDAHITPDVHAFAGRGLDGIANQIVENLRQALLIRPNNYRIRSEFQEHVHIVVGRVATMEFIDSASEVIDVELCQRDLSIGDQVGDRR